MNCMILRLWLVIALLCGLSDSAVGDCIRLDALSKQCCLEQAKKAKGGSIESNDGVRRFETEQQQWPMASSVVRVPHAQSVSGSRPTRVSPTSGGKSGRFFSRWMGNDSSNLSKISCQLLRGSVHVLRGAAMAPHR